MTGHSEHRSLEELIAYQLGELDEATSAAVEQHFFDCDICTARLEAVQQLGAGVAGLVRAGLFAGALSAAAIDAAAASGVQVRTYALGPGGSVACTAAPGDDLVVVRFALADSDRDLEQVDVRIDTTMLEDGSTLEQELPGLPVDRASGELVLLWGGEIVRGFQRSRWQFHVGRPGEEAPFTQFWMNHTPWDQLPPDRRR